MQPDQPTTFAPPEARQAAADAYDDAYVRKLDVGQMTALIADAVWQVATPCPRCGGPNKPHEHWGDIVAREEAKSRD